MSLSSKWSTLLPTHYRCLHCILPLKLCPLGGAGGSLGSVCLQSNTVTLLGLDHLKNLA